MASTTSKELTQWQMFLAVRAEREEQRRRDAEADREFGIAGDDDVIEWGGDGPDDGEADC